MHSRTRLPSPAVAPAASSSSSPSSRPSPRLSLLLAISAFLALVLLYLPQSYLDPPSLPRLRRLPRRALRSYQRLLHVHPLESRALSAGFIFLIADFFAQLFQTSPGNPFRAVFNFHRLVRYSLYGLFFMGPFLYLWYATMNAYGPPDDFRGSLVKCFFEQLTLEPICILIYMVYDSIVCRKGVAALQDNLQTKLLPLWFKNALFWLPANFANYYIGTPDLRVVFANLCSLFWNIYFSGKVNKFAAAHVDKRFLNHDRHPDKPFLRKPASEHLDAVAIRV